MFLEITLVLFIIVLLYLNQMKRPDGLPPGDWGYPIFGRLLSGRQGIADRIEVQKLKYGNISSCKIGSRIFIFLADYKLIKTAFSKVEFSGRPDFYTYDVQTYFRGYGISLGNGPSPLASRKFALKTLSDFGMGKSRLERIIDREISEVLENLSTGNSKPFDWNVLHIAILNVIWQITADKRFNQNDDEIKCLIKAGMKSMEIMNICFPLDILPWLKMLPNFIINAIFQTDELDKQMGSLKKYMETIIDEHVRTFDKSVIRDLIDAYLLKLEETGGRSDETRYKNDLLNLNAMMKDLFIAGTETTAYTLQWFFLYMCKFPEAQEKIHREIDCNIDQHSRPTFSDRKSLPYLEATIHEVNRMISLVPNSIFHSATVDADLEGYRIPKGSVLCPCLEVCHMSPEYFEDPHIFRPERFLNLEGTVDSEKEGYFPFSVGRRSCIGNSLATMELFLFLSAVFQKYYILGAEPRKPDFQADTSTAFLNVPKPYPVILCDRKNYCDAE